MNLQRAFYKVKLIERDTLFVFDEVQLFHQAVNSYVETKNFALVDEVKRDILTLYRNDISKFAQGYESRVKAIFDTIPGQLTQKEKKYTDNELYRAVLFDKLNVNEGMLMENIAAQSFRANGRKLFFYSRSVGSTRAGWMEVDFLVKKKQKICPVEVKSSSYRKHSSLDKFRTKFSSQIGECYILYQKDVMVKEGVIHLPIYMAMFI